MRSLSVTNLSKKRTKPAKVVWSLRPLLAIKLDATIANEKFAVVKPLQIAIIQVTIFSFMQRTRGEDQTMQSTETFSFTNMSSYRFEAPKDS